MPVNDARINAWGFAEVLAGGAFRALAALPTERKFLAGRPEFALELPESRYRESDLSDWGVPVLDQGGTNACGGFMAAAAYRYAWRLSGQQDRPFNPYWVYGWVNGGRDAGSQVGQCLAAMRQHGVAVTGDPKDGDLPMDRVYFPRDLAKLSAVQKKAARFRVYADYRLRTVADLPVALTLGFLPLTGILVDRRFGALDAEGVAPLPDRRDPYSGGHALALVGLKKSRKWGWCYLAHNSWGRKWGNQGFAWIHNGHFTESGWPFDTWALQACGDDPAAPDMPAALPFAA